MVAPFAGAWIEIKMNEYYCGITTVAPFAGAWIEINLYGINVTQNKVAPFAGAWIEIIFKDNQECKSASLPSRERGLKLLYMKEVINQLFVAPFAGAWIEISIFKSKYIILHCRSLRGSVD